MGLSAVGFLPKQDLLENVLDQLINPPIYTLLLDTIQDMKIGIFLYHLASFAVLTYLIGIPFRVCIAEQGPLQRPLFVLALDKPEAKNKSQLPESDKHHAANGHGLSLPIAFVLLSGPCLAALELQPVKTNAATFLILLLTGMLEARNTKDVV